MSEHFDYENEGEIIEDPMFMCERCGYANVRLVDIDGRGAAKCTSCGVAYITTE
jgi:transcription elongation factor Elf1